MIDLNELKQIIGKNIIDLRKKMGLTQAELAEKINYSDKAVSKWECGDAVPDIAVLKRLAEILNVTVDYLLQEEHEQKPVHETNKTIKRNQRIITALSVSLVWLISTLIFIVLGYTVPNISWHWLLFVYSCPVSLIVLLVFNSIWGRPRSNFAIITALVWLIIASIYLTFLDLNLWMIFLIGIPSQIIIVLWSGIKKLR
ncbi:MAG: helix-turn-helix domain-containing protein [Clostridia bacterium]|nr:helix-turn-helix domain-containing protein [Clostridia bacterium]